MPLSLGVPEKPKFHNDVAMQQEPFCTAAVHVCGGGLYTIRACRNARRGIQEICPDSACFLRRECRELSGSKGRFCSSRDEGFEQSTSGSAAVQPTKESA
jgi:hypothetical protein